MTQKIAFSVGKFNPPHIGHGSMLKRGAQLAADMGLPYHVFVIDTNKRSFNSPLDSNEIVRELEIWTARQGLTNIKFTSSPSLWHALLEHVKGNNLYPVLEISGSDRNYTNDVSRIVNDRVPISEYRRVQLDRNDLVMSSTKLREYVVNNDYVGFHSNFLLADANAPEQQVLHIWEHIRKRMNE